MGLAARIRCLEYDAATIINDERNQPRVVEQRDSEVLLILACGILNDIEVLLSEDYSGDLLERNATRVFQPRVFVFIPDDVHKERIAACIYNVNGPVPSAFGEPPSYLT